MAVRSLETRRRAVADALRAVADEAWPRADRTRLDHLSGQVDDVLRRLNALEAAVASRAVGG